VERGYIKLEHVKTGENLADFFTKPLGKSKFMFRDQLTCEF
jgi:hypothetical protein